MVSIFRSRRRFWAAMLLAGAGIGLSGGLGGVGRYFQSVSAQETAPAAAIADAALPRGFVNVHALIIVRHADVDAMKKTELGNATPLLPRGEERAKELAYALKDAGITRIVTSTAQRTQETAAVLAKELKITPETPFEHHSDKPAAELAAGNSPIDYIANVGKPTDTVLLVYHHSVIPSLLKQLGYTEDPAINEEEFDRIYVVLPDPAKKTYHILRLRYGGDWHLKP